MAPIAMRRDRDWLDAQPLRPAGLGRDQETHRVSPARVGT